VDKEQNHLTIGQLESVLDAHAGRLEINAELLEAANGHLAGCENCQRLVSMHKSWDQQLLSIREDRSLEANADCPPYRVVLELAAGAVLVEDPEKLMAHISECSHCGPLLRQAVASFSEESSVEETMLLTKLESAEPEWQERMAARITEAARSAQLRSDEIPAKAPAVPPRRNVPLENFKPPSQIAGRKQNWHFGAWLSAAAVFLVIVSLGGWLYFSSQLPRVNRLVEQAYTQQRTSELRLGGAEYGPVRTLKGGETPRLNRPETLLEAETLIAKGLKLHPEDPGWLHARARTDILEGDYEEAIAILQKLRANARENREVDIDLATSFFLRGRARATPDDSSNAQDDYGQAAEIFAHVLDLFPKDSVALFNQAITLEQLSLYRVAAETWQRYLQLDPNSPWSREARDHLAHLTNKTSRHENQSGSPLLSPDLLVSSFRTDAFNTTLMVTLRSERYLALSLEYWLPAAFPSDADSRTNSRVINRALDELAQVFFSRHADGWLLDFLSEMRREPRSRPAVELLVSAIRLNKTADLEQAHEAAGRAARLFAVLHVPSGQMRAIFETTYADQLMHQSSRCHEEVQQLRRFQKLHEYKWLDIQTILEDAACSPLSDEKARTSAATALTEARAHGYGELELRAATFLAAFDQVLGDDDSASSHYAQALERYWDGDFTAMRGYSLYAGLDEIAEDRSQWHLAAAHLRQALSLIEGDADKILPAIEHERLGQVLLAMGDFSGARNSFELARQSFSNADPGLRKTNIEVEAEIGLASVERAVGSAEQAVDRLQVVSPSVQRIPDKDIQFSFSQEIGLAYAAVGNKRAAEESLLKALELAEASLLSTGTERERFTWSRKTEGTYRALVHLKLHDDPGAAFTRWEWYKGASLRARISSTPSQLGGISPKSTPMMSALPPANEILGRDSTLIAYAVFPEGTVVWAYGPSGVEEKWIEIPSDLLERKARNFADHCADPHSNLALVKQEGRDLYTLLFSPIASMVAEGAHVVVEPDGELEQVPFEAMVDETGRYIGERHTFSTIAGVHYLEEANSRRGITRRSRAFVIGEAAAKGWVALPDAEEEAHDIASFFENAKLSLGESPDAKMLARELAQADVFHFSGHAVAAPSGAGLVLGNSELLDAKALEKANLRQLQLVVLSSCKSSRGSTGTFNDSDSLARNFLAGGVPNVVASRWMVESAATASFTKSFYAQLLSGNNVSRALQISARTVREKADTGHPYFWAGFTVFGKG
jgi:tetratricopeptide (TPR) repeat protein